MARTYFEAEILNLSTKEAMAAPIISMIVERDPKKDSKHVMSFLLGRQSFERTVDGWKKTVHRLSIDPKVDFASYRLIFFPFMKGSYEVSLEDGADANKALLADLLKKSEAFFAAGSEQSFQQAYNLPGIYHQSGSLGRDGRKNRFKSLDIPLSGLSENNLNGIGLLALLPQGSGRVDAKYAYCFHSYYAIKQEIPYRIVRKGREVKVEIDGFRQPETAPFFLVDYGEDLPYQRSASVSSKPLDASLKFSIDDEEKGKELYFRLRFADPKYEKQFALLDLGNEKRESGSYHAHNPGPRLCPYCLRPLAEHSDENPICRTDNLVRPAGEGSVPKESKGARIVALPKEIYNRSIPEVDVGIVGVTSSGKTTYVSALLGLQNGADSDLSYLNRTLAKVLGSSLYLQKVKGYVEVQQPSKADGKPNVSIVFGDLSQMGFRHDERNGDVKVEVSRSLIGSINPNPPYKNYAFYPELPSATNTNQIPLPFVLTKDQTSRRDAKAVNIILNDFAGETLNGGDSVSVSRFKDKDGYIVLLSPDDRYFNRLFENLDASDPNTPIAIVFTKFDSIMNEFDPSSWSLEDDIVEKLDKTRNYQGSALEELIDRSSEEIKAYFRLKWKANVDGLTALDAKLKNYRNVRYFAISSMGLDSVWDGQGREKDCLYYGAPFRVELPLLYILAMNGIF